MGWGWTDDQSRITANVGLDSLNYQGVNAIWTLRQRSFGGDVEVDFGARHVVAGSDIGHRAVGHRDYCWQ